MILLYETGHQFYFWGRSILQRNEWRSGKRKIQGSLDACNWRTERKFGLGRKKVVGENEHGRFSTKFSRTNPFSQNVHASAARRFRFTSSVPALFSVCATAKLHGLNGVWSSVLCHGNPNMGREVQVGIDDHPPSSDHGTYVPWMREHLFISVYTLYIGVKYSEQQVWPQPIPFQTTCFFWLNLGLKVSRQNLMSLPLFTALSCRIWAVPRICWPNPFFSLLLLFSKSVNKCSLWNVGCTPSWHSRFAGCSMESRYSTAFPTRVSTHRLMEIINGYPPRAALNQQDLSPPTAASLGFKLTNPTCNEVFTGSPINWAMTVAISSQGPPHVIMLLLKSCEWCTMVVSHPYVWCFAHKCICMRMCTSISRCTSNSYLK